MLIDIDIQSSKRYFENRRDIAFAFLFGSHAKGRATKLSDIDIAVYFYPEKDDLLSLKKMFIMEVKMRYGQR